MGNPYYVAPGAERKHLRIASRISKDRPTGTWRLLGRKLIAPVHKIQKTFLEIADMVRSEPQLPAPLLRKWPVSCRDRARLWHCR
jgi:hypothetical protein